MDYEIDDLDRQILAILQQDARTPFQEIARSLLVSGGTIHVRVNKLREHGIIKGTKIAIDPILFGYDICAFIGVNLHDAQEHRRVVEQLKAIPEVLEAHFTTGTYALLLKVVAPSTRGLHSFLVDKLQAIGGIQSTETLISLDACIERELPVK